MPDLGYPDDAMIFDEALYNQLHPGFCTHFDYSCGIDEVPCALYRDWEEEREWPAESVEVIGKIWIVVVDYHF